MQQFIRSFVARQVDRFIEHIVAKANHTTIEIDGQLYLTRYYIGGQAVEGGKFEWWRDNTRKLGEGAQVFLHHFHSGDQGRELHNHPYTGTSLILKGGYYEERMSVVACEPTLDPANGVVMVPVYGPLTAKVYKPGMVNTLTLDDFHRAELLDEANGAWTLFVTGPRVKGWGFLDRATHVFSPYMSASDVRTGGGPHTRGVRKAPSVASRQRAAVSSRKDVLEGKLIAGHLTYEELDELRGLEGGR